MIFGFPPVFGDHWARAPFSRCAVFGALKGIEVIECSSLVEAIKSASNDKENYKACHEAITFAYHNTFHLLKLLVDTLYHVSDNSSNRISCVRVLSDLDKMDKKLYKAFKAAHDCVSESFDSDEQMELPFDGLDDDDDL